MKKACTFCRTEFDCFGADVERRRYCSRQCHMRARFHAKTLQRFYDSVIPVTETGCWLFEKGYLVEGYAYFSANGRRYRAHRWSYEQFVGPIGEGLVVRHICDVPCCVNPRHLILGTQAENNQDCVSRQRSWWLCRPTREQRRHPIKSRLRMVEFDGQTKCLTDWAEATGIPLSTIAMRLRRGWSIEKSLKAHP